MGSCLVTGVAGCIGAHVVREMVSQGIEVTVLDNFSTGISERLPSTVPFVNLDCRDIAGITELCANNSFEGLMHFAASKQARESVRFPFDYWAS